VAGRNNILRDRKTRLIAIAGCGLAVPLFALAFMALAQTRYIAAALESRELTTLRQSARLAARELGHVVASDENHLLEALELTGEEALMASLARAEEADDDVACFAVMVDGRLLYPPAPGREPAWVFDAARQRHAELQASLNDLGRARVYLSAPEGAVAASLFKLEIGDEEGLLGVCWDESRVASWCEAVDVELLPAGLVATLSDAGGRVISRHAGSGRPAGPDQPGPELSATVPLEADGFSLILTVSLEDRAEITRMTRRHVWFFSSVLLVLALLLAAGIWLLVAVALREIELTRIKADFAANVSHELRTPLALIRAAGEALSSRSGLQPAQTDRYLGIIGRESKRLNDLIHTVLTFSRIEQHGAQLDLQISDVAALAREVADDYRERIHAEGFAFDLQIPEFPLACRADPEALRLALANLLDNAMKFSADRKDIALRVEVAGAWAALRVRDRGIGISPEDRDRIFESFYRGERDLVKKTRGTGIGLALVDAIVKAHGGRVEVESAVGQGSTFSILLPAAVEISRET